MSTAIRPFAALLKRELWEHRAFWIVPVVIACLLTVMGLWGLSFGGVYGQLSQPHVVEHINEAAMGTFAQQTSMASAAFLGLTLLFTVALCFVTLFYLLDALYADRRDRSFLFWKSMPVSDLQTVLSKVVFATVVAPIVTLAVATATALICGVIASAVSLSIGIETWWLLLNPLAYLDYAVTALGTVIVFGLIFAPVTGWLLLASAWARRAPFLWAALPPLVLAWIEEWVFDTNHFIDAVAHHFERLVPQAFAVAERSVSIGGMDDERSRMRMSFVDIDLNAGVLADPQLWVGVAIAAAFIAGAVYLRRYRDEA